MDLQKFLEEKAEGPTFTVAVVAMISRAAAYYSGQEANFRTAIGTRGMEVFNTATGFALAAGCELLASIAGRNWRRNSNEAHEAATRKGLNRLERESLVKFFGSKARLDFLFMLIGLSASFIAALSFLWESNPDHSPAVVLSEVVLTTLLLSVISYLGIFKEGKRHDTSEANAEKAQAMQARIVDGAGNRIASGQHTIQDVRLFARQLPKIDRDRFMAAFAAETPDDPHWTTTDIANWLDCNHQPGKRQITRKLAKLAEAGAPIMRDERGAYIVPRSAVFLHFADDFLAMSRDGRTTPTVRTVRRPSGPLAAQESREVNDAALSTSSERRTQSEAGSLVASVA